MKKMKNLSIALFLALTMGLGGCSSSSDGEETDNNTTNQETQIADTGSDQTEQTASKEGVTEYNQAIASDDLFDITLTTIEYLEDSIFGDSIEITFTVLNKSDMTVEVQAREISFDNKMVDDSLPSMSQEISAGKTADCVLTLISYDDSVELPAMEDNMELTLHIFSWDDWDFDHNYPVTLNF